MAPDAASQQFRSPPRSGPVRSGPVRFDRSELRQILSLYGRMVAAGFWRDYAIDHLADAAVFSIFRKASEVALFRIEKRPGRAQGMFSVHAPGGLVLKRGHELARVLEAIDRRRLAVIG